MDHYEKENSDSCFMVTCRGGDSSHHFTVVNVGFDSEMAMDAPVGISGYFLENTAY